MNKRLFAFLILALVVEVLWLFQDLKMINLSLLQWRRNNATASHVGQLALAKNEVRRRSQNNLFWDQARKSEPLHLEDTVLTMEDSAAEIALDDGGRIFLEPNTLIVLSTPKHPMDPLTVTVKRGRARVVRRLARDRPLEVVSVVPAQPPQVAQAEKPSSPPTPVVPTAVAVRAFQKPARSIAAATVPSPAVQPAQPVVDRTAPETKLSALLVRPFLTWPRFQFEVGSHAGFASYQSKLGTSSLSNGQLSEQRSTYFRIQGALGTRFLLEAHYDDVRGKTDNSATTVLDKDFRTVWSGFGVRYRFLSDPEEGLAYYAGVGIERSDESRYAYQSTFSTNIVNRPVSFDECKLSLGVEYRSYYGFRGRMEVSYYQMISAAFGDGFNGIQATASPKNSFSADGSLSHTVTSDTFLGLGVRYRRREYDLTTNELGASANGTVSLSHMLFRVFIGVEL